MTDQRNVGITVEDTSVSVAFKAAALTEVKLLRQAKEEIDRSITNLRKARGNIDASIKIAEARLRRFT